MTLDKLELNRLQTNRAMQWLATDKLITEELLRIDRVVDMDLPEWGEYVDQLADTAIELERDKYIVFPIKEARVVIRQTIN